MESPLGGPSHWSAGLFFYVCFFQGEGRACRPGRVAMVGGPGERFRVIDTWVEGEPGRWPGRTEQARSSMNAYSSGSFS